MELRRSARTVAWIAASWAVFSLCVGCANAKPTISSIASSAASSIPAHTGKIGSVKPGLIDVYFVRHAETMANYSGHYNTKTEDSFAPSAQKSLPAIVKTLHNVRLDAAICSPQWRTMATALPVLKDHHMKAVLWPELNECCNQIGAARLKPPRKSILHVGPIKISSNFLPYFQLDPTDNQWIANGDYQDGLIQVKLLVKKFLAAFQGKAAHVLVVGHGYCGGRFLESLLGLPVVGHLIPGNAVLIHLRQQPDGSFKLISMKGSYWHK